MDRTRTSFRCKFWQQAKVFRFRPLKELMLWLLTDVVLLSWLHAWCVCPSGMAAHPPAEAVCRHPNRPGSAAVQLTSAADTLQRSCWLRWRRRWRPPSSWVCPPPVRRRCGSRATTPRCSPRTAQVPPARHDCTARRPRHCKNDTGVCSSSRVAAHISTNGDLRLQLAPGAGCRCASAGRAAVAADPGAPRKAEPGGTYPGHRGLGCGSFVFPLKCCLSAVTKCSLLLQARPL